MKKVLKTYLSLFLLVFIYACSIGDPTRPQDDFPNVTVKLTNINSNENVEVYLYKKGFIPTPFNQDNVEKFIFNTTEFSIHLPESTILFIKTNSHKGKIIKGLNQSEIEVSLDTLNIFLIKSSNKVKLSIYETPYYGEDSLYVELPRGLYKLFIDTSWTFSQYKIFDLTIDSSKIYYVDTLNLDSILFKLDMEMGILYQRSYDSLIFKYSDLFKRVAVVLNGEISSVNWTSWLDSTFILDTIIYNIQKNNQEPVIVFSMLEYEWTTDSMEIENNFYKYITYYNKAINKFKSFNNKIIIIEPFLIGNIAKIWQVDPEVVNRKFIITDNSLISIKEMIDSLVNIAYYKGYKVAIFLPNWGLWFGSDPRGLVYWVQQNIETQAQEYINFLNDLISNMNKISYISLGKEGIDAGALSEDYMWSDTEMENFLYYSTLINSYSNKPILGFLLPIGTTKLNNTLNSYQDTFVEYFFSHSRDFYNSGYRIMIWGPYKQGGTLVSDSEDVGDRGYLINSITEWKNLKNRR